MKLTTTWKEKMRFLGEADGHSVPMDTKPPIGTDTALSPKQLILAAICGCTGMDVVALLKKYKQPLESFTLEAEGTLTGGGHPIVFQSIHLLFKFSGAMDRNRVLEAVQLSQTKYCSVSAMISKAAPITYAIELNSEVIGTGAANFT
jgi:putative redox protein